MCPRATAEHGGAAMAMTSAHSFGEEEYIDLDLSSCGEYEFRVCRSRAPCADETPCRGRTHRVAPRPSGKLPPHAEATAGGGSGGRRSTATVAPLQQSHVRSAQPARAARAEGRGKAVRARLQASRAFFRSLFARTSCSDHDRCRGGAGVPCVSGKKAPFGQFKNGGGGAGPTTLRSSIEQEKEEEEEHAASIRQRKSFSGVIRWRPSTTRAPAPTPAPPPPPVSSTRRKSCGSVPAALTRSSSCRSECEPEGLIQGAIAYCKRTQQQQQQQRVLARKSVCVSDAALCSSSSSSSSSS